MTVHNYSTEHDSGAVTLQGEWAEYKHLVTDPAHLGLELTLIIIIDVLIGMLAWPLIKKAVRRHDTRVHGTPEEEVAND